MNILGFDTAGSACSVALLRGDAVAASRFEAMARGHAEALMPMIQEVLGEASVMFEDLDALAVTVGPGSFTGLRVGLATARGLSLARSLPLVGATTLETVAFGVFCPDGAADRDGMHVMSAMETRREDIYVQTFSAPTEAASEPVAAMPEDIEATAPPGPLVIAGDAARRAFSAFGRSRCDVRISEEDTAVDARRLVRLARRRAARWGLPNSGDRPVPLYIHPPRASLPANQGRLRP